MKNICLGGIALFFLFGACKEQEVRYTQNLPEINAYKKVIDALGYELWKTIKSQYSETTPTVFEMPKVDRKTQPDYVEMEIDSSSIFSSWTYKNLK